MVNNMIKSTAKKKCASIEYENDYFAMADGLTNPYCYNFGRFWKDKNAREYAKIYHVVNENYFDKR